jgi:hypothetical protein
LFIHGRLIFDVYNAVISHHFEFLMLPPQRCADFSSWLLARADEFTLEALQVRRPPASTAAHALAVITRLLSSRAATGSS